MDDELAERAANWNWSSLPSRLCESREVSRCRDIVNESCVTQMEGLELKGVFQQSRLVRRIVQHYTSND
jgi:hypothetical protein